MAATIGILALQGAFARHARVLEELGHLPRLVRGAADFAALDGLVLPGGESTVQLELCERLGLAHALRSAIGRGIPVLATCAGLVLSARTVLRCGPAAQASFGFVDVAVERNGWGRQLESFEAMSDPSDEHASRPLVFIRAPRIVDVGPRVRVLATLRDEPVLVRDANVTAATFHPELTGDNTLHAQVFGGASARRRQARCMLSAPTSRGGNP
jgi:pyridoxal 5'-phosphate synthase pdxT subunit